MDSSGTRDGRVERALRDGARKQAIGMNMIQAPLFQPAGLPEGKRYLGKAREEDLAYLNSKRLTAISLFSGCGGAALGVRAAGYEVRVFVEWEKNACETLRRNWTKAGYCDFSEPLLKERAKHWGKQYWHQKREPVILQADITKLSTEEILAAADLRVGECSLLEGGFPCQGFSTANSARDGSDHTKDKRNVLYKECVRVIRESQPKCFFLENVPGLVSMENGRVIRMITRDLAECGYTISWNILNAADYGVPQNRLRVFIIGTRNDLSVLRENGAIEYHIGGTPGPIAHPAWYAKKYKLELERWEETHDQPRGKNV